ncbi:MAG TPA: HlyD family efflux transporter periplasmic adaptor subunit [Bacillota bacterium]|nr:HlyD family efflux transporter periplasmic adaptor subunit [Candidatus Fermentithermobacillaceae bacterium]HOQ02849.1 HlyD family efflux transporter periplasmic adaptor subunit [Bacillota bacterium]
MQGFWAKWKRWVIVAVVAVAVVGLGYWGIKAVLGGDSKEKLVMVVKPVTRGDIEVTVWGWGNLEASREDEAISGASGVVKEVFFEIGDQVAEGQPLAFVDAGSIEIDIRRKEITLDLLRLELAKAFGVTPEEVANVDPETALIIKAPISGRIEEFTAQVGAVVPSPVCKIVDNSTLESTFLLPKSLFDKVAVGQKASFACDRFDGFADGTVTKADPTPIAGEQSFFYEVQVQLKNPGLLRVGDKGFMIIKTPDMDVQQKVEITGYAAEESVTTPFTGKVKEIFVKQGAEIKEGEPILQLEAGDALLKAMEKQLEYKQAVLELDELRSQLGNVNILSPIDGVVMSKNITKGQNIAKGTVAAKVSDFTEMDLLLNVDEMDIAKLSEGQVAMLEFWGPEGRQEIEGIVSKVGVAGEVREGMSSFNVIVHVVNPGFLRPGMWASAEVFVAKKEDVLLCPVEAVYKEDDKWMVDVKDGDQRKPVEVEIGAMNYMYAEIISGLSEGQEVVVAMSKTEPEEGNELPYVPY